MTRVRKRKTDKTLPPSGVVRTMRYEVVRFLGDDRAARSRMLSLSDACREVVNVAWQEWESRHIAAGNHVRILDWMREFRLARDQKRTPPLCPVADEPPTWEEISARAAPNSENLFETVRRLQQENRSLRAALTEADVEAPDRKNLRAAELGRTTYLVLSDRFPQLNKSVLARLEQAIKKKRKGKDSDGIWNMWQAVLAGRQGRPSAEKSQPIPFEIGPMRWEDGATGRVEFAVSGNVLGERVIVDTALIKVKPRSNAFAVFDRCLTGEYAAKGSQLQFHKGKKKWFFLLSYQMPGPDRLADLDGVAYLRAARHHPLRLRLPWRLGRDQGERGRQRTFRRGRNGKVVAVMREKVVQGRWRRQANYWQAGSANKGHGRERCLKPIGPLGRAWKGFTENWNRQQAREIARILIDGRVAKLVFVQPTGDFRDTRFLASAGKTDGRRDSTGWDWFQLGSLLQGALEGTGIEVVVAKSKAGTKRKVRERQGDEGKNGTVNKDLRHAKNGRSRGDVKGVGRNGVARGAVAVGVRRGE